MKKIRWWLDIGFANAERKGEVEVEDDATDAEIEQAVREEVMNYVEWGWSADEKAVI